MSTLPFADRLMERCRRLDNPSVMGLDPNLSYLPPPLLKELRETGLTGPELVAEGFLRFNQALLESCADLIAAVKFQSACYEQYGHAGIAVLEKSLAAAKELGYLTIIDAKRNDIGSTAAAYARALIGSSPLPGVAGENSEQAVLDADALTVNAYLGSDGVKPFLDVCAARGKGCFLLVRTSNPSAAELQDLELADGRRLYEAVADLVAGWSEQLDAGAEWSSLGAVVGATWPEQAEALRQRMSRQIFLIPGYGAQGAGARDATRSFVKGEGGIINASRSLMLAWQKEENGAAHFAEATRREALRMRDDLNQALKG